MGTLDLVGQLAQGGAEALGLGFIPMHDRILKQRIQPLDLLNRLISLWHRHNSQHLSARIVSFRYCGNLLWQSCLTLSFPHQNWFTQKSQ